MIVAVGILPPAIRNNAHLVKCFIPTKVRTVHFLTVSSSHLLIWRIPVCRYEPRNKVPGLRASLLYIVQNIKLILIPDTKLDQPLTKHKCIRRKTLNARMRGAGNRDSVSSSANVLQAAKAAALLPSSAASSAP